MTENDIKNLKEIREFLEKNNIKYSIELGNFCLFYDEWPEKRRYEIEYVRALDFPIEYPKYDIEGVDKNYFFNKSIEAEKNNSFKMWIKDFEWDDDRKRPILKSQILHAYGITPHKFYARECIVKEVGTKEGREFEVENCFYGKRGASLSLGLYLKKDKNGFKKDTLLMLYTFGMNFFGKSKNMLEVLRVGTLKKSYVTGGASKLLKHFIKNYETIKIGKRDVEVSVLKFYSDYDHNLGSSMQGIGFKFHNYSKGGFMNYWAESGEVRHRQPMKHKWVMTQIADGKCRSIPNAGVKTFLLDVSAYKKEVGIA
ncbi:MAG: hypothetical protein DRI84_07670 [Bacteroidetes bacterium]|nr:MAG: hypothetical protein DRI84_07670 [Bacteroidota bacterium]